MRLESLDYPMRYTYSTVPQPMPAIFAVSHIFRAEPSRAVMSRVRDARPSRPASL